MRGSLSRGVATGGGQGGHSSPTSISKPRAMTLPLKCPSQTRSKNFSFKHQGYCFLQMFRYYMDHKFNNFYRVCYNFWTIYGGFLFFLTTYGIDYFTLRSDT